MWSSKIFTFISILGTICWCSASKSDKYVEEGNQLLGKGDFAGAISSYHQALEEDPKNVQALFRRATAHLAVGKPKTALFDFDSILQIRPDWGTVIAQRAELLYKQGDLDAAEKDANRALKIEHNNLAALKIGALLPSVLASLEKLKVEFENNNCGAVYKIVDELVKLYNQQYDAHIYKLRAKCYEKDGNLKEAIHDLGHVVNLANDKTDVLFNLSRLQFEMGSVVEALRFARECLRLDADHKQMLKLYKKLRKIVKQKDAVTTLIESQDWEKCVEKAEELIEKNEMPVKAKATMKKFLCRCRRETDDLQSAISDCTSVFEVIGAEDPEVLCDRAEAYLLDDDFDSAIRDFEATLKIIPSSECAEDGRKRAEVQKKQAGKRDYYRILGVKRNANKREITKAYRKLAQKWHPDNFSSEEEKKRAEKKFINIASAKEVLTDEEKRRQFDAGIDPLNPEESRSDHHHGSGFHTFNGFPGGFSFGF